MAIDYDRPRMPEVAVSASAALGGVASVFAWAACCVLPLALSVAGVSFAGAAVIAGARNWLTLLAAVILAAGWLLVIASLLIVLSMAWQPYIEPWVMPRLAAMR